MDSDRETDEIRKTGDVITYVSESPVDITTTIEVESAVGNDELTSHVHNDAVGKKITKDFGKLDIFFGEVQSVEYDTNDAEHKAPFYVVVYTDGDKEDFNEQELAYGGNLLCR